VIQFTDMPQSIAALPRDDRGYPVPWFVGWYDGKPEFRCADGKKLALAIRERRCWVCGEKLDPKQHVFVIGPMCAINRTTAEPPSHAACAVFSAINCPFLSRPKAVRREANLPEISVDAAGIAIPRNPGVTLLWYCKDYQVIRVDNGLLFKIPGPSQVRWFREGRKATRDEIMESINTGVPILKGMAEEEGPEALQELHRMTAAALKFVPAA
jgi:hypothetical protein